MTRDQDISARLRDRVRAAQEMGQALCVRGGGSKDFYGREPQGQRIDIAPHCGIVSYEPTELVITARAGTPLTQIEHQLAAEHQMLPFEPPHLGATATLGGTIACNLSGPRRPYSGAARDMVLGTRVLNGRGEILSFGGEVMKNVAGYDVSRLMAGALGTLGILLDVSIKVLPKAEHELTLSREARPAEALGVMHGWAQKPYPVSATCYDGNLLYLRLSGERRAVEAARKAMGGEIHPDGERFWYKLREQRLGFFDTDKSLWRLSVASDVEMPDLEGKWLHEWGGALRWLVSEAPAESIREAAAAAEGHATQFRGGTRDQVFHPLPETMMAIHRRLKAALDPKGVLNPGRLYSGL